MVRVPLAHPCQTADLVDYRSDLGALHRHPVLEELYIQHFNPRVRAEFGSTEAYLREKLGWYAKDGAREREKAIERGEGEWWRRDSVVNCRRNDWSYGIPAEIECVRVSDWEK